MTESHAAIEPKERIFLALDTAEVARAARLAEALRGDGGPDFALVVPGIRPSWAASGDQKRVMTPAEAVALGADYLVVGRPIAAQPDPLAAERRIVGELAQAVEAAETRV